MDITRLPDKWREEIQAVPGHYYEGLDYAANQLEATLPKWTKMTDDPATWPEDWQHVLIFYPEKEFPDHKKYYIGEFVRQAGGHIGSYWRPLCSLDAPPEE